MSVMRQRAKQVMAEGIRAAAYAYGVPLLMAATVLADHAAAVVRAAERYARRMDG